MARHYELSQVQSCELAGMAFELLGFVFSSLKKNSTGSRTDAPLWHIEDSCSVKAQEHPNANRAAAGSCYSESFKRPGLNLRVFHL